MNDKHLASFKYHFLRQAQAAGRFLSDTDHEKWRLIRQSLVFARRDHEYAVSCGSERSLELVFPSNLFPFYKCRDQAEHRALEEGLREAVAKLAAASGLEGLPSHGERGQSRRLAVEKTFHDDWAAQADVERLDVLTLARAATAPEMRYITGMLGNLKDKKLLDLGCGLGEAGVYFALLGAEVTVADISPGMLRKAEKLAALHNVSVRTCLMTAEDLIFPDGTLFDIVYAGNLLHHVDLESTLAQISRCLTADGRLVTWDPLAYNPAINIYRRLASGVRTVDEHPLRWRDLKSFEKFFGLVQRRYFWLCTLLIFILMYLQGRDPNKERYWKSVVREAEQWSWLYKPLEKVDGLLLRLIPILRLLCWNVVVIARKT